MTSINSQRKNIEEVIRKIMKGKQLTTEIAYYDKATRLLYSRIIQEMNYGDTNAHTKDVINSMPKHLSNNYTKLRVMVVLLYIMIPFVCSLMYNEDNKLWTYVGGAASVFPIYFLLLRGTDNIKLKQRLILSGLLELLEISKR